MYFGRLRVAGARPVGHAAKRVINESRCDYGVTLSTVTPGQSSLRNGYAGR